MWRLLWKRPRSLLVILLSATVFIILTFQFYFQERKGTFVREPAVKYILIWNKYFHFENLGFDAGHGKEVFQRNNCSQSDCFMTDDRSLMPPEDFDSIAFHMYGFQMHSWSILNWGKLPSRRKPEQRYIFFLLESPVYCGSTFWGMENLFNWTMTYRLDSDVVRPYAEVVPLPGVEVPERGWATPPATPITPEVAAATVSSDTTRAVYGLARVAWLVSHCTTHSKRELLAERLAQHVHVDVFGDCGRPWPKDDRVGFHRMLSMQYHFYLAFENSLCRDYVTEKLFHILPLEVVPVVYGGANYSAVAPPYSYIDARTFETPRHLAEYLEYLVSHPDEYQKFFWWKKYYRVEMNHRGTLCNLCEKLHEQPPPKSYADIGWWWRGESDMCEEPADAILRVS